MHDFRTQATFLLSVSQPCLLCRHLRSDKSLKGKNAVTNALKALYTLPLFSVFRIIFIPEKIGFSGFHIFVSFCNQDQQ